jgi:hypothetical protein
MFALEIIKIWDVGWLYRSRVANVMMKKRKKRPWKGHSPG